MNNPVLLTLVEVEAHLQAGRFVEAEDLCRQIAQEAPYEAEPHRFLGQIAYLEGRTEEAETLFRKAVQCDPSNADAHENLCLALMALGRFVEAEVAARHAVALRPAFATALYNLGVTLVEQGRTAEAVEAYRQSLSVAPHFLHAAHNLGNALGALDRFTEAETTLRYSLTLPQPSNEIHAVVENSLGTVLMQQGRMEEAAAAYRRALGIAPDFTVAHSNALLCLHNLPETDLKELAQTHADWDKRHAQPLRTTWRQHASTHGPDQPLRLGLVSADLGQHPVGFFSVRVLESLDRREAITVCYSSRPTHDAMTERIAAAAGEWRETRGLSDAALAEQIRGDQIDILFDLGGHTSGNRLLVFARKPAPVQVTWLGYVGTTGLTAMDYLLADRFHVREGEEEYYTEKVLRMPHGYACYGPPEDAPQVGPLPAREGRESGVRDRGSGIGGQEAGPHPAASHSHPLPEGEGFTFGCFNNPAKYAPSILNAWAEVLRRVPGSRLLLKYGGLDDPQVQERLRGEFARRGVEAERILLEGWSPHHELLAAYNRVDLALDTQPYSGGLTTCEALWMGVPVITFPGQTFAGRHSVSHLTNAGYPQFIAADAAGYVELAVEWAGRLDELAAIRSQMREQVRNSPLCDAPRFARNFLAVVRAAWESRVAVK